MEQYKYFFNAIIAFMNDLTISIKPFSDAIGEEIPVTVNTVGDERFDTLLIEQLKTFSVKPINKKPRIVCDVINPISISPDQLSNPYQIGQFISKSPNGFEEKSYANVKRIPIQYPINVQFVLENVHQYFAFLEILLSNIWKYRTYEFQYKGCIYQGTYDFGDSFTPNSLKSLTHDTEKREIKMEFEFIIDLQYPAFNMLNTLHDENRIQTTKSSLTVDNHNEIVTN